MSEDDRRSGLRVGGWIPPYPDEGRPVPAPKPATRRGSLPNFLWGWARAGQARRPPPAGTPQWIIAEPPPPEQAGSAGPDRRQVGIIAAAVVAAAVLIAGIGLLEGRPGERATLSANLPEFPLPAEPSAAVSVRPEPTVSTPTSAGTVPAYVPGTRHPATHRPTHTAAPTRSPAVAHPRPKPVTGLVVGTTIGLEPTSRPGTRLRHRNFVGRIDRIGSRSSDLDRADSQFRVRRGRASSSCFSLESVNYPDYFLRHRNFVLRLDRRDGSHLFDLDSTFCPVPVAGGAALVLRSVNYPDRYLVARDDRISLDQTSPAQATAFTVQPPA